MLLTLIRSENSAFVRVNPSHAWFFARACNLPKTDKVDAKMLSTFGSARNLEVQITNSVARDRLKSLVRRRRQYKDMIMAALSVIAQGKLFRPFIKRMKSEGKANKTIIMAVARKLLVILNTLVQK